MKISQKNSLHPETLTTMKAYSILRLLVCAALVWLCTTPAPAAGVDDNIYNYLQVLRSDFNSGKVDLVNKIMKLSEADAKKFWPLYRAYESELGDLAVTRAELIAEFVQAHQDGTFDNARARDIAKRWFKGQRARLDLLEKYHGKIEKILS